MVFTKVARKPGQVSLFETTFAEDILKAIQPGDIVERYGRQWRFSQPERHGSYLFGKLGFVRLSESMQAHYDEDTRDFFEAPEEQEHVHFSHWVLNLESQVLVFEKHGSIIDVQSFVGAFRLLLGEHPEYRFTLELLVEPETFYEWQKTLDKLVHFHAVIRPPNPHWTQRTDRIKALIDEPRADLVTIDVSANEERQDGLRVEGTILQEFVEYQGEGYAAVQAEGFAGPTRRTYDSKKKVETRKLNFSGILSSEELWQFLRNTSEGR